MHSVGDQFMRTLQMDVPFILLMEFILDVLSPPGSPRLITVGGTIGQMGYVVVITCPHLRQSPVIILAIILLIMVVVIICPLTPITDVIGRESGELAVITTKSLEPA